MLCVYCFNVYRYKVETYVVLTNEVVVHITIYYYQVEAEGERG